MSLNTEDSGDDTGASGDNEEAGVDDPSPILPMTPVKVSASPAGPYSLQHFLPHGVGFKSSGRCCFEGKGMRDETTSYGLYVGVFLRPVCHNLTPS